MSETLTASELTAAIEAKTALADEHRRRCLTCSLSKRCKRGRYLSASLRELQDRLRELQAAGSRT